MVAILSSQQYQYQLVLNHTKSRSSVRLCTYWYGGMTSFVQFLFSWNCISSLSENNLLPLQVIQTRDTSHPGAKILVPIRICFYLLRLRSLNRWMVSVNCLIFVSSRFSKHHITEIQWDAKPSLWSSPMCLLADIDIGNVHLIKYWKTEKARCTLPPIVACQMS